MDFADKCRNALYAGIVGDALGVPVENSTRQELALCAVKNMLGYGRYDQPEGTWSDDSSMIFATMASLCRGYDLNDMAQEFCTWLYDGKWTAIGHAFDAGITTSTALDAFRSTRDAHTSGCVTEDDNGNGSLMRILPAVLYFAHEQEDTFLSRLHEVSSITHATPRAQIGCGIYGLLVRDLLRSSDKEEAYANATARAGELYERRAPDFASQLSHYSRILGGELPSLDEKDVYSSGYIVHTLEAAVWCFMSHENTKEVLLAAVNLGLDTDTTGTVAGGLSGAFHGMDSIPGDWTDSLAQRDMIDSLIGEFIDTLTTRTP